jgi:hypothetical protein
LFLPALRERDKVMKRILASIVQETSPLERQGLEDESLNAIITSLFIVLDYR